MTVVYIAASSSHSLTATSLSVDKPSGTLDGHVMCTLVLHWSTGGALTVPAGWTLRASHTCADVEGLDAYIKVYTKTAQNEGASYLWQQGGSDEIVLCIASFSGVNVTNPVLTSAAQSNSADTNFVAPGITLGLAGCMLLFAGIGVDSNGMESITVSPPGGMTEAAEEKVSGWSLGYLAYELLTAAGATGTRTATFNSARRSAAALLALRPASSHLTMMGSGI